MCFWAIRFRVQEGEMYMNEWTMTCKKTAQIRKTMRLVIFDGSLLPNLRITVLYVHLHAVDPGKLGSSCQSHIYVGRTHRLHVSASENEKLLTNSQSTNKKHSNKQPNNQTTISRAFLLCVFARQIDATESGWGRFRSAFGSRNQFLCGRFIFNFWMSKELISRIW